MESISLFIDNNTDRKSLLSYKWEISPTGLIETISFWSECKGRLISFEKAKSSTINLKLNKRCTLASTDYLQQL